MDVEATNEGGEDGQQENIQRTGEGMDAEDGDKVQTDTVTGTDIPQATASTLPSLT